MAGKPGGNLRKTLVWSYERGTVPYDIICGLILAFIFFMPRSCFVSKIHPSKSQTPELSGGLPVTEGNQIPPLSRNGP